MTKRYKSMTIFCFIYLFLHTIFDKDRVLPYQADILPLDQTVVRPTEKPEKLRSAVNDQRYDPRT